MSDDEELPPSKLGTKVSSDVHGTVLWGAVH